MIKLKNLFYLAIIILLIIISFFGYSAAKTHLNEKISSNYSSIRVVMDDNYPPYIFKDSNGNIQGVLVDQWKLWEKKTGIKVEIHALPWDEALTAMKNGEYDVIDTVFENAERKALFDFSKPYAQVDVPIYFKNNISGITNAESLSGFNIAVKRGDSSVDFLKKNGIDNLTYFDSYQDMINAANKKIVSIFVMDKPPAQYLMYKAGIQDKFNSSKPLYTGDFHRAVKKGNTKLLSTVEKGFSLISKNEYNQINNKWFGNSNMINKYYKYIEYCTLIIIAVLVALVALNRTLKKKVFEKTKQLVQAVDELKERENENDAMIKAIPDIVFKLNNDGFFLDFLSENLEKKLYVTKDQFIGKTINQVFPEKYADIFMSAIKSAVTSGELQILEYQLPIENRLLTFEARIVNYNKNKILVMARDITEKKANEDKIYKMSMFDVLTDLYNRNYFENELARLEKEQISNVAIVICDVDGLKLVNDSLGHAKGDEYLKTAAKILKVCFKEKGIIARIGGDEFAVLLKDASEEEISTIKNHIIEHLDKINSHDILIPMSISIGFSVLNEKNKDLHGVFREADDFMYREKLHHIQSAKGKNIEILMSMLEARDFATQGHENRMGHLAALLAKSVGMSDEQISEISLFTQFHDIGKIGIPDNILFKNGKLTDEEKAIMNRHTEIGYRIAKSSPDLVHISDLILKHHETWDGNGYPFGIKGEEIPIQCRIVSIVDAYDAMTNDRPYRKAMGKQQTIDEIQRCSGKQFDPNLVEKFIQIIMDR
ncbi:MAG: diguanylate cyclase with sensor [Clostridiaceae bacterium]|jgi:diguanylate cyclase (GGDEF)-like protein|nr:diguanylate cyclase with sensor [Clostridiaceae bacterium]